jgi:N-acetylmuramic acid 6-phosphate etherase
MSAQEIVRLMNEEEYTVLRALTAVEEPLARAAERVAHTFQAGGRTILVGSGTSGRIAVMEAAEMPATFGVGADRFVALVSGGPEAIGVAVDDAEDDEYSAVTGLNDLALTPRDLVIGLTAGGRTPFAVAAVCHAKQKGIFTCGIANTKTGSLLRDADLAIFLDTGPEVLTGSTRLKAATAQKLALDQITTAAMVLSGKVVENLMVDVHATSQKLKERCARIVRDLSSATFDESLEVLAENGWNVRRTLEALERQGLATVRAK